MKRSTKKIITKILLNITLLLLICLVVILFVNIPPNIGFTEFDGVFTSTIDFSVYKENVLKTIKIILNGELLTQKIIGKSLNVGGLIRISLGRSMIVFFISLLLACLIGVPKGIFDSRRKNKTSNIKLLQTLIPLSAPDVLTISAVQLFAYFLFVKKVTLFGVGPIMHIGYEGWTQSIYPIIALSLVPAAYIARVTASAIEVVYDRDYILAARGKGCSESRIIYKHIMPNVLTDLIGAFPAISSIMFSSLFIVERIFYYPGVAYELMNMYENPASDGSSGLAFLGLSLALALIYFILYTALEVGNQIIVPRLKES